MRSELSSKETASAGQVTRHNLISPPTPVLERVVRVAAALFDARMGGIWAAEEGARWAECSMGLDGYSGQARSLWADVAVSDDVDVVGDARDDPRLADSPLVTGHPGIRFCAAAPLRSREGACLGTLFVMDTAPRTQPPTRDHDLFAGLASIAAGEIELRLGAPQSPHPDEAASHLAAIVESSDDAIITKSLDGTVLSWNAGAQRLYGYSAAEIVGRPISTLVPPDRPNEVAEILAKLKRGEKIEHHETVRVRKDGNSVDVSVTVSPIRNAAGEITGASTIARDISERKQAEDASRRAREETIRKLSIPVLRLRTGLLLAPLIGDMDSHRSRRLTQELLRAIQSSRARVAVLDVTGVPEVDSDVAYHLLQAVEASRLMGANVVVTGLGSDVAQTLVDLGLDLGKLTAVGDLQSGIEEAERLLDSPGT